MGWYALYVKTGEEDVIKDWISRTLIDRDIRCFIPKKRITEKKNGIIYEVLRVIFPGYIFVNTIMNFSTYYTFKRHPSIYKLLNYFNEKDKEVSSNLVNEPHQYSQSTNESEFFKKIPYEEISTILALTNDEDIIEVSSIILDGSNVLVKYGPLKGLEGIIKKIDKRKLRAKISIRVMNTEKMIDVAINMLQSNSHKSF